MPFTLPPVTLSPPAIEQAYVNGDPNILSAVRAETKRSGWPHRTTPAEQNQVWHRMIFLYIINRGYENRAYLDRCRLFTRSNLPSRCRLVGPGFRFPVRLDVFRTGRFRVSPYPNN